ncbi:MAG: HD domain-containing protein [Candidatus Ozemobacteraceae bacterium]
MSLQTFAAAFIHRMRRAAYWLWKFWRTLHPVIDENRRVETRAHLPELWRPAFDRLLPPDQAHVIRLWKAIKEASELSEPDRAELLLLAVVHDLGKGITRPTIFERVAKALLPLPNSSHPIAGARLLKKWGAPRDLIRRVRFHHEPPGNDRLLALFQSFDDSV